MAVEVGVDMWQQLLLLTLSAMLVGLLGWILLGKTPDVDEDDASGKQQAEPLPVFGANFGQEAKKEAKRAGAKKKKAQRAPPPEEAHVPAEAAPEPVPEEEPQAAPEPEVVPAPKAKGKKKQEPQAAPEPEVAPAPTAKGKKKQAAPVSAPVEMPVAPVTMSEAALTPEQRAIQSDIRKQHKKLREVADLKAKQAEGQSLTGPQRTKIEQEASLVASIQEAERSLEQALSGAGPDAATEAVPEAPPSPEQDKLLARALAQAEAEEEEEEFQESGKKRKNNKNKRKQEAAAAAAEEQQEEEEEDAGDMDDPLAMLGGMGVEEVYKVTMMEEKGDEDLPDAEAEAEEEQEEEEEEEAEDEAEEEEAEEEEEEEEQEEVEDEAAEEAQDEAAAGDEEQEEVTEVEEEEDEPEAKATEEDEEEGEEPAAAAAEEAEAEEAESPAAAAPAGIPKDFERPKYPPTEREKEMMKVKKKIREIDDLERKQSEGTTLAVNQQAKLLKKDGLLEELETLENSTEPHTVQWDATVEEIMNPTLGVHLRLQGKTELMTLSAAHMNPPISTDNLGEIPNRYRLKQELKVRIMRNGKDCTDMSIDEEDWHNKDSLELVEKLEALRKTEEEKISALDERAWSVEIYDGIVVSVKDNCCFVRVLGCREVRIAAQDMPPQYTVKDPKSGVFKPKRDAVKVGMEAKLRLKWDTWYNRVNGQLEWEDKE